MKRETMKRLRDWPAAKRVNAVIVADLTSVQSAPSDRYVCFETRNFGWIMTPVQPDGKRKIYLRE